MAGLREASKPGLGSQLPRIHRHERRRRECVSARGQSIGVRFKTSKCRDVTAAARFLGVSPSLVYAYVERKQIPHFRIMGRAIRFRLSELEPWRQQFHVNGGING